MKSIKEDQFDPQMEYSNRDLEIELLSRDPISVSRSTDQVIILRLDIRYAELIFNLEIEHMICRRNIRSAYPIDLY